MSAAAGAEAGGSERFYFNFTGFPFPLGPFLNRRTIRTEVTSPLSLARRQPRHFFAPSSVTTTGDAAGESPLTI